MFPESPDGRSGAGKSENALRLLQSLSCWYITTASVKKRAQNGKRFMENKRKKAVRVLILAGMAVCLIPVGQAYYQSVQHREQQEDLKEIVTEASVQYPVQTDSAPQEIRVFALPAQAVEEPAMLAGYAGLYEENNDLAAGTNFIIYGHNMRDGFMFGDTFMTLSTCACHVPDRRLVVSKRVE